MYQVTEDELNALHDAGNYKTLDLALFSACASAFLALAITLLTVDLSSDKTFATFAMLCFAACVGWIFFGGRAWLAWKAAKTKLATIKRDDAL